MPAMQQDQVTQRKNVKRILMMFLLPNSSGYAKTTPRYWKLALPYKNGSFENDSVPYRNAIAESIS